MNRSEAGKLGHEKARLKLDIYVERQKAEALAKHPNRECRRCRTALSHRQIIEGNQYCSRRCSGLEHGPKVTRRPPVCERCGGRRSYEARLCQPCAGLRRRKTETKEAQSNEVVFRILVEKRGRCCEGCGLAEWIGEPIPLEVHHEDGDGGNNAEANVKLLCPNCHAMTPTYKSKNAVACLTRRRTRRSREFAQVAQQQSAGLVAPEMSVRI